MKKTTKYRDRDRELEIRMAPMIDVVFLLLVFFVWTASFRMVELNLPINLSAEIGTNQQTEVTPEIDFDQIVVKISGKESSEINLNDVPVAGIEDLEQRMRDIAKVKNDIDVIIHPSGEVTMETVVEVFDIAQFCGFLNVKFATPAGGL